MLNARRRRKRQHLHTHIVHSLYLQVRVCTTDILSLCPNETLGKGAVIACLLKSEASLSSESCKHEVSFLAGPSFTVTKLNR